MFKCKHFYNETLASLFNSVGVKCETMRFKQAFAPSLFPKSWKCLSFKKEKFQERSDSPARMAFHCSKELRQSSLREGFSICLI